MKHLDDEDIAMMIDGRISKGERECFWEHLFQCDACLMVYNESLNFVDQEDKKKFFLKKPNPGKITERFWKTAKTTLASKELIPMYAVLFIAIILLPFLLIKENARVKYIEKSIRALKSRGIHSFTSSNNLEYAAVRAGIFAEELSLLVEYGGKEDLKGKIADKLVNELRIIFKAEINSLLPDLVQIEERTFETVIRNIKYMLGQQLVGELFQFGRFVEQSILGSFNDKLPSFGKVKKYCQLIGHGYNERLPAGVLKELNKFTSDTGIRESNDIFLNIKEIFLSAE